jgi:hypothetical protein
VRAITTSRTNTSVMAPDSAIMGIIELSIISEPPVAGDTVALPPSAFMGIVLAALSMCVVLVTVLVATGAWDTGAVLVGKAVGAAVGVADGVSVGA